MSQDCGRDVIALDKDNGNIMWDDTILKEMKNLSVAFNVIENCSNSSNGCHFLKCHMIFDIKMGDFHHKARFLAGGNRSREIVQITFKITAFNELKVMVDDIMNAYISAPNKENMGFSCIKFDKDHCWQTM